MNVSRVYRLLKVIATLKSGRRYSAADLAIELGVSRRTLFRDLNLLEQAGIPYRFEHHEQTYRIADSFFLPPLHLNLDEALALLLVTRKIISRDLHPQYEQAIEAAMKIESSLPPEIRTHCGQYLDGVSLQWRPTSDAHSSVHLFRTLQRALAENLEVSARYDSIYDRREIDVVLEPWRLMFVSRGWYLIAHSLMHGESRTFKLERFISIRPTGRLCDPQRFSQTGRPFGAAWQMIRDGTIHQIRLEFSELVAQNVEEVMWHPSQSTRRLPDGRLLFEAEVDGLREIVWWILGYGDQVVVVAPDELRRRVGEIAARVAANAAGSAPGD